MNQLAKSSTNSFKTILAFILLFTVTLTKLFPSVVTFISMYRLLPRGYIEFKSLNYIADGLLKHANHKKYL